MDRINQRIATELGVGVAQVVAAVELLGEGSTVPFIARYRKEKTGGLDDTQLRKLEERLGYLREAGTFLGQVHLEEIEQVGEDPEALAQDFEVLPVFDGLKVGASPSSGGVNGQA